MQTHANLSDIPLLIGLSGKKRVGKDTLAQALISDHHYKRFAVADAIKDAALAINPVIASRDGTRWARLRSIYNDCGGSYEGIKASADWDAGVREFLQNLGGEIALMNPTFWPSPVVEASLVHMADTNYGSVITDIRFPWEAEMVRDAGGLIVRVHRSDFPDENHDDKHMSETAMDSYTADAYFDTHPLDANFQQRVTELLKELVVLRATQVNF